jgi:hypothetical protein
MNHNTSTSGCLKQAVVVMQFDCTAILKGVGTCSALIVASMVLLTSELPGNCEVP